VRRNDNDKAAVAFVLAMALVITGALLTTESVLCGVYNGTFNIATCNFGVK
jgi:hypothetical protein